MSFFGVYDDEMPNDPLILDDATIEAFLSGHAVRADELGPLACFARDLRIALDGPSPAPRPDLAMLLSTGFSIDKGDLSATAASNVTGPASQAAGLPKWRKAKMFVSNILAGVAAKAVLGVSVAAASVVGAGAAGMLPASVQHDVAAAVSAVTPFHFPDPSSAHTTLSTKGSGAVNANTTTPAANTGGAVTGIARANETPAAGHVPTTLPSASSNTGSSTSGSATTGSSSGLNQANQTPAAGYVPTKVPASSTTGSSTSGSSTSGSSSTQVSQTPGSSYVPSSAGRP